MERGILAPIEAPPCIGEKFSSSMGVEMGTEINPQAWTRMGQTYALTLSLFPAQGNSLVLTHVSCPQLEKNHYPYSRTLI